MNMAVCIGAGTEEICFQVTSQLLTHQSKTKLENLKFCLKVCNFMTLGNR